MMFANGLQALDFRNTTTLTVHCSLFAAHASTRQGSFGAMLLTCIVTHFCEAPLARFPWFLQGAHLDSTTAWTAYFLKLRPWISATSELQSWSLFCWMCHGARWRLFGNSKAWAKLCFSSLPDWQIVGWLCCFDWLWLVCIIMASKKGKHWQGHFGNLFLSWQALFGPATVSRPTVSLSQNGTPTIS